MSAADAATIGGIYRGLKILELGAGAAGPVATGYFAEHGASVIRIESAVRPDFLRLLHVTA
ncbi:MAG: CoA transferase, partial [Deltaproteobacteria bacterium]|nr:CoA transferase [Deltaproteobacteria bacterium]